MARALSTQPCENGPLEIHQASGSVTVAALTCHNCNEMLSLSLLSPIKLSIPTAPTVTLLGPSLYDADRSALAGIHGRMWVDDTSRSLI